MATEDPNSPTARLQDHSVDRDSGAGAAKPEPDKAPTTLEEDDEFEDFPVEDWPDEETEAASGATAGAAGDANAHLWEESWDDDDDASEEFSKQLKEELEKVKAEK